VDLALVVGGTASKEVAVSNGRFESGRGPKIEGLGRLDVIMAVKEDGGFARSFQRFRIDERVEIRGNDVNRFKSGGTQVIGHPARTSFDVRLVLALGADARDSQEITQLRQVLVAAPFNKFSKIHKRPSGDMCPFE